MKPRTVDQIACPFCKGDLQLRAEPERLFCESCKLDYRIVDGVPVFINDDVFDKYNADLKQQNLDEEQTFYEQMYSDLKGLDDGHCVVAGYDDLYQFMQGIEPGTLLDVGCGAGHHSKDLARLGFEVTGIDISLNGLKQAREVNAAAGQDSDFILADIENLPLKDNSYDIVFCGLILHHFPKRDKLLKELNRVCRKHFVAFEVNAYDPVSFFRFDVLNPLIGLPNITKNQRTVSPFRLAKELRGLTFAECSWEFLDVHHYVGRYPDSFKAKMINTIKGLTNAMPVQYKNNKFMLKASRMTVS